MNQTPVVDPVDVDTHVRDFDAAWPEPTVPVAAPATIDPILEAHFPDARRLKPRPIHKFLRRRRSSR